MNYSVYILFGNDATDAKIGEFTGNTDWKTHMAAGAVEGVSNLVGFEVWDTYANKISDEKSVALTGNVTEMTFQTAVSRYSKYQKSAAVEGALENFEDVGSKALVHTLTVKGNLEYPNILFKLGKETAKKKDTSRIWQWANTPLTVSTSARPDNVNENAPKATYNEYYRHVVATVFSTDDRQFRAIVLKDAFVGSYNEYFDINGDGHFTLVVNKIVNKSKENAGNGNATDNDISATGPNLDSMTFSSVMGDIGKAANTAGKLAGDVADASATVFGKDSAVTKTIRGVSDGATMLGSGVQAYASDGSGWTTDNIAKDLDNTYKYVKNAKELDNQIKGKESSDIAETTTETQILSDKSTETAVTTTNPDGSKVITTTIVKPDGTKSEKKETIAAKDEGIVGDANDENLWKWKKPDEDD